MRTLALIAALALGATAHAVGPTVEFTLPVENTTPSTFGSLPFPDDLYFDQGRPGDGDGTLLNAGSSIGLSVTVEQNTASIEDALDLMDGFGTTSAIYFFFSGPIDVGSLPASPVLSPSRSDSVFCADTATLTPVPIALKFGVDTRVPNMLGILPLPGRPLKPKTSYTCVVRTTLTGGGDPVTASGDWLSVRDGTSANGDADAIFDPVVSALGGVGVPASAIAGMTVFTTESTTDDLRKIRDVVLPGLPTPTVDFTSQPGLVFDTPAKLQALLGRTPNGLATIATGFYDSARFQTHDPDGDGVLGDFPDPNHGFVNCLIPCETTDESFTHDGMGNPIVIDVPKIALTVTIPSGTPPPGGWPIIIQQHGLGGQRDTVVAFAEADAAKGFASIGIDAAGHGYRLFNCGPSPACSQDTANNFGGTAVPDGFVDGGIGSFSVSFLAVNLGFFQAFHNFLGIRDNFRQTYADLLSLVRLIQGHALDGALGTTINDGEIFYMGHSLGGLMGSGFMPIETNVKAALLNATGGELTNQLFNNSSIGAGALSLVEGILGLDPASPFDSFAISSNLIQSIVDPADGVNSASLLLAPDAGSPRNVIQIEDYGDQVVPNQANEAIALASGLPIFDPYVQDLHQSALSLPIANPGTPGTVHGNLAAGAETAVVLQNGPATHASSVGTVPGTVTFVPEFAHIDDFLATGNGFPTLVRGIRVPNAGVLGNVLDWFADIVTHGTPGTFSFGGAPNFNPIENADVPAGNSNTTFFARTVDAGGQSPTSEPTPDVVLDVSGNTADARFTAGRSILGTSPEVTDDDVAPGRFIDTDTPGVLPFFVTLQRNVPGTFGGTMDVDYTPAELLAAGIPSGSTTESELVVGSFVPGHCMGGAMASCAEDDDCGNTNAPCVGATYDLLPTTITPGVASATISDTGIFAVLHPNLLTGGAVIPRVPGGGSKRTDCGLEWEVVNPTNTPFMRKTLVNPIQTCADGDPTCDHDGAADGTCTFRVAVCLNQTDATLPACTPTSVANVHAFPSHRAGDQAVANAFLTALESLGGTLTGHGLNDVSFAPPLTADVCTAFTQITVPVHTRQRLRLRSTSSSGASDLDKLRLVCNAGS
jgi:hypothetical protein